jgi:ferrous iron transport protein A
MPTRSQASLGRADSGQVDSAVLLSQLAPGRQATIIGMVPHAPTALANRLRQMGFRPAANVAVIRLAPLGDPAIYRVQDTEFCLRRREAGLIEVAPEADR